MKSTSTTKNLFRTCLLRDFWPYLRKSSPLFRFHRILWHPKRTGRTIFSSWDNHSEKRRFAERKWDEIYWPRYGADGIRDYLTTIDDSDARIERSATVKLLPQNQRRPSKNVSMKPKASKSCLRFSSLILVSPKNNAGNFHRKREKKRVENHEKLFSVELIATWMWKQLESFSNLNRTIRLERWHREERYPILEQLFMCK